MVKPTEKGNAVYAVAIGKLDDADYDRMLNLLRGKITTSGTVRWYFEMRDFDGWTPHAFWRDIEFDLKNKDKFERIAMVGENKWQKAMTEFMKIFSDVDMRYFDSDRAQEAKHWLAA